MNKYFIPLILIFEGISSWIFDGSITKTILDDSNYNEFYSFLFVTIGVVIILGDYFFFNSKEKMVDFSKCPKCKESFNYYELKNGKCKYCKNIYTLDIDEYYKKYPEEVEK